VKEGRFLVTAKTKHDQSARGKRKFFGQNTLILNGKINVVNIWRGVFMRGVL
jgi:hypothetical protein